MTAGKRIIITGAGGFIGGAIFDSFRSKDDFNVLGTVSSRSAETPRGFLAVDLLNYTQTLDAFGTFRPDIVINAAGKAHMRPGLDDFSALSVNVEGVLNSARAASEVGAKKFIQLSSVLVYGQGKGNTLTEDSETCPSGPYAESKHLGEQLAIKVSESSSMALTIFRLAMVPGTGNYSNLSDLASALKRKRFVWIGRGANRKSMVCLTDVVGAVYTEAMMAEGQGVETFNIAQDPITMSEVVSALAKGLSTRAPAWAIPAPIGRIISSLAGGHFGVPSTAQLAKFLSDDPVSSDRFQVSRGFQFKGDLIDTLVSYGRTISDRC